MTTALATTTAAAIAARRFDTSILAGTKSPNTIEQYKMHFAAYCDFAGSFADAMQPATLARWRQHLYENGYTLKDGTVKQYSVNAINQRLAAIRGVMVEAAQQGTLKEIFGSGTAAVISPVNAFSYQETLYELPELNDGYAARFKKELTDIQYNLAADPFGWRHKVV